MASLAAAALKRDEREGSNEALINLCMIRRGNDDAGLLRAFIEMVPAVLPKLPATEPTSGNRAG